MSKEDKKKSEDTTGKLTTKSAFLHQSDTTPTAQEMIDQIRVKLSSNEEDLKKFNSLLRDMPNGFCLKPIKYTKIEPKQNDKIRREFVTQVREDFLKFLANNHSEKLFALGITKHGIKQMKNGSDPENKNGVPYNLNVDHKIDISGSGSKLHKKKIDSLMPTDNGKTFLPNHFSNLILLPNGLHDLKNWLINLQKASKTKIGQSIWVLTMVPETVSGRSGFVAAPQDSSHPLYGLTLRSTGTSSKINGAHNRAIETAKAIRKLRSDPTIDLILTNTGKKAERLGGTVVEILMRQEKHPDAIPQSLSKIFNRVVSCDPYSQEFLNTSIEPLIEETTKRVKAAFVAVKLSKEDHNTLNRFNQVFYGHDICNLREEIKDLPIGPAMELHKTLQKIGKSTFVASNAMNRKDFTPSVSKP